jgi:hypothetical protein
MKERRPKKGIKGMIDRRKEQGRNNKNLKE